jgi:thioredoxin-related protein
MKPIHLTAAAAFAACSISALSASAYAQEATWIEDNMPKAMEQAKAEGKDILIDFTGSDWCGWCIRLKQEVFTQSEFTSQVPEHFVLVMLDFPARKPQSDEAKAHNAEWQQKFEIRGYPTIVLTDASGEPYARTGYREGGPVPYVEHLQKLREGKVKRDKALEAAKGAQGIERAKLLDEALNIDDIIVPDRQEKMKQIIALDSDNEAGLKQKYEQELRNLQMETALKEVEQLFMTGQIEPALSRLDEIEAEYTPSGEAFQNLVGMRVALLINSGNTEGAERAIANAMTNSSLDSEQRQMIAVNRINIAYASGDMRKVKTTALQVIALAPDSDLSKNIQRFVDGLDVEEEG